MSKQKQLRDLMFEHQLSRQALAERVGWSLATVHAKLRPETSRAHRAVTDRDLDYVRLKLAESKPRT
jgi:AraC-like DNA-binding protein